MYVVYRQCVLVSRAISRLNIRGLRDVLDGVAVVFQRLGIAATYGLELFWVVSVLAPIREALSVCREEALSR